MKSNAAEFDCVVVGHWHLAFVTAASVASLGRRTALCSLGIPLESTTSGFPTPPVAEPNLPETIARTTSDGTLSYRSELSRDFTTQFFWLAIDTPVNEKDEADTRSLEQAALKIREYRGNAQALLVSSQIPLGFSKRLAELSGLPVVYIPENLRLGKGLETFLKADRTVIGTSVPGLGQKVRDLLQGLQTEFLECDLATAEMIKHATNAFLATSISFANEIARIGEQLGVDCARVGKALKMDKRIGNMAYVEPGLGFAGGTLPRDLRILQSLGTTLNIPTPLSDAVLAVNTNTTDAISSAVSDSLGGLKNKRILIVGYTYKADTDTLRRSLSVELAEYFRGEGAIVWGYDPKMNDKSASELEEITRQLQHFSAWREIPGTPDAVLILTPRAEFKTLDWSQLRSHAPQAAAPFVLDARLVLSAATVTAAGFDYKALWQPVQKASQNA